MADVYVATHPIDLAPGVRAHNAGDVVPHENIVANGWQDLTAKRGTKAADAVKPVADVAGDLVSG